MSWNKNEKDDLIIDVGYLMTPLYKCVKVDISDVSMANLSELEEKGYDYGVIDFDNNMIGCINTEKLKELCLLGNTLSFDSPEIKYDEVYNMMTIFELLEYFTINNIAIVADISSSGHLGIVTLSDLNRSYLRSIIYVYLSELELLLESHIKENFDDVQMWIDHLSEESQVKIWGNYYVSQRKNVELDPIEFCGLEELFRIIYSKEIREFFIKKKYMPFVNLYKKNLKFSDITSLRDVVVHPIRPLIFNQEDVIELNRKMIIIKNIIDILK